MLCGGGGIGVRCPHERHDERWQCEQQESEGAAAAGAMKGFGGAVGDQRQARVENRRARRTQGCLHRAASRCARRRTQSLPQYPHHRVEIDRGHPPNRVWIAPGCGIANVILNIRPAGSRRHLVGESSCVIHANETGLWRLLLRKRGNPPQEKSWQSSTHS